MKTKILKTLIPSVAGILAVLVALLLYNLIFRNGIRIYSTDIKFFTFFVPVMIFSALLVQYLFILPLWEKLHSKNRLLRVNLFWFVSLVSVIGGIGFGFVFWEKSYGTEELGWLILTGIIAFVIYQVVNLITLQQLNQGERED